MFRTLSRILRNNHIIRILTICEIIALVSFVPVFAQATTQDVSGMTQTVYNFTLWSDFTTNVDYYYGSQTASYSDTTITTIARWLNQIKYYYADQTQTLYMYVPSTNTIQSVTGRHIPEILSYLNYNMAQDAKINYESELLLSRLVTQMGGTNGSYVQDIALDIDSYLPSLTELSDLNDITWYNSPFTMVGVYDNNNNQITSYDSNLGINPLHFRFNRSSGALTDSNESVFRVSLPVGSWYSGAKNNFIKSIKMLYGSNTYYVDTFTWSPAFNGTAIYLYFSIPPTASNYNIDIVLEFNSAAYITNSLPTIQYIDSTNIDYYTVTQLGVLRQIANKDFTAEISGNVTVDTTNLENKVDDIIDTLDDLSLTNNDVKLNLTINNNTGSDGSNIIGRLQNFFSTGTSISDFFDNVDDAESGWFTQTNSDLINTLSGGYVNLYE